MKWFLNCKKVAPTYIFPYVWTGCIQHRLFVHSTIVPKSRSEVCETWRCAAGCRLDRSGHSYTSCRRLCINVNREMERSNFGTCMRIHKRGSSYRRNWLVGESGVVVRAICKIFDVRLGRVTVPSKCMVQRNGFGIVRQIRSLLWTSDLARLWQRDLLIRKYCS